jgi:predicted secreted hydrolase
MKIDAQNLPLEKIIVVLLIAAIIIGSIYILNKPNEPSSYELFPADDKNSIDANRSFAAINDPTPLIELPKDEGTHDNAKEEWWYFNGHLYDKENNNYGIMICFFKNGKLYYGIADEDRDKFYGGIYHGLFKASTEKFDVSLDKNTWTSTGEKTYRLHTEEGSSYIDLDMTSEKPPLLVGGEGVIQLGNGGESSYYSQTRLRVNGKLDLGNGERTVSGIGWIDRQWGNWDESGYGGWEWFSIQLTNKEELHVFNIFDPLSEGIISSMVNIVHADGKTEVLASPIIEPLSYWTDPEAGNTFSHKWKIKIPEKDTELIVTPTIDNQLITPTLWEGSCRVEGRIGKEEVSGWAYAELTHRYEK